MKIEEKLIQQKIKNYQQQLPQLHIFTLEQKTRQLITDIHKTSHKHDHKVETILYQLLYTSPSLDGITSLRDKNTFHTWFQTLGGYKEESQ